MTGQHSVQLPLLLLCLLFVGLFSACSDPVGEPDGPPDFPGIDGDQNVPDGDGNAPALPSCRELCGTFCDWVATCPENGLTAEERLRCRSLCTGKLDLGTIDPRLVCASSSSCVAFVDCLARRDGSKTVCVFDPTDGDASDGDTPSPDGDASEIEGPTGPPCSLSLKCPTDTLCDPLRRQCLPSCNPRYASCDQGWVCRLITDGELAGQGKGVCDAPWTGEASGGDCQTHMDCAPRLQCGKAKRCEAICDPAGFDICPQGVACTEDPTLGVATCAWCLRNSECPANFLCHNGQCLEDVECRHSRDCDGELACVNGRCTRALCRQSTDCAEGTCDSESGFCYANVCEENCASRGLCCWRHECGPCCASDCPSPLVCAPDASCYPALTCCSEQPDCRMMPRGFCGGNLCSPTNGACGGACRETCTWGYECGRQTGYQCKPVPPVACQYVGMTCQHESCMECNGEHLGDPGWCVAAESCGLSALPEGFTCDPDPLFALECASGLICCRRPEGGNTCCPQARCHPGLGCLPEGETETPAAFTCPSCDTMLGEWKRDSQECPAPWNLLVVSRNPSYDCVLDIRHSRDDWQTYLASMNHCEAQVVYDLPDPPGYDRCLLFWDANGGAFAFHCASATRSCQTRFSREE